MPDLEQRTTELLQRLIQFNTVNPPGNEEAAQEFLKETLESAGFECELLAAVEGRPNLVARLRAGSDGPPLALLGHVDTVLADADDWSVDPWSGEIRDDCVWGRGALDMKSQVAAEVAAACALASEGWRPESGELLVIVTADEEVGAAHGAKWLCEQMPDRVRCDLVVNEGGGPSFSFGDKRYYLVEIGEKGVFRFTLTTRGAAGHELSFGESVAGNASPLESPLMDHIRTFVSNEEPGAELVPYVMPGFTDSRWFREAFAECVAYGFFPMRSMDMFDAAPLMHGKD